MLTINNAIHEWLGSVGASRQKKTFETYRCAANAFMLTLNRLGMKGEDGANYIHEHAFLSFIEDLQKKQSVATERLYITAVRQFYKWMMAEGIKEFNLMAMEQFSKTRARRIHVRLPEFPEAEIESVLEWVEKKMPIPKEAGRARLRALRNRAFMLTLADTGLRGGEACRLKRGNISWDQATANVIGKNGDEAVVHFTKRSLYAIKLYLNERAPLDNANGTNFVHRPIFARHDLAAGKKITAMTTTAGRDIMRSIVNSVLTEIKVSITPHKLRHYFCTMVYNRTNDLKLTMELARHKNIEMTTRYTHQQNHKVKAGYRRAMKDR